MKFSDKGKALLKNIEGLILKAQYDVTGWSIGYGCHGPDVIEGLVITEQDADDRLDKKTDHIILIIQTFVKVALNQNQIDALVIFIFNIGEGSDKPQHESGFEGSTMLKLINQGDFISAANEFPKWCHSAGVVNQPLLSRRLKEQKLFLSI